MSTARDCIIYARYSTDRQNPKSCEDQLREVRSYASAQGWRVIGQYPADMHRITGHTHPRHARGAPPLYYVGPG